MGISLNVKMYFEKIIKKIRNISIHWHYKAYLSQIQRTSYLKETDEES